VFPRARSGDWEGATDGFLRRQTLLRVLQVACSMNSLELMRRL